MFIIVFGEFKDCRYETPCPLFCQIIQAPYLKKFRSRGHPHLTSGTEIAYGPCLAQGLRHVKVPHSDQIPPGYAKPLHQMTPNCPGRLPNLLCHARENATNLHVKTLKGIILKVSCVVDRQRPYSQPQNSSRVVTFFDSATRVSLQLFDVCGAYSRLRLRVFG